MPETQEFSKVVHTHSRRPLSGGAPLTIIEFSLTDEVRDRIKTALTPYVTGQNKDKTKLAEIFSDPKMFPQQVLDELRGMSKNPEERTTAFVIRNLPEIDKELIPEKLRPSLLKNDLQRWLKDNSFSTYIAEGLAGAAKLPPVEHEFVTARHADDVAINGAGIHKHGFPFGTINVIATDGAPTRLVDMRTLLDSVEKNDDFGEIVIDVAPGNAALRGDKLVQMPLWELKHGEHALPPVGPDVAFKPIAEHAEIFEKKAAEHSRDIVGQKGDMIIWPDDGLIFHQAIAKDSAVKDGELLRAITVRALGKLTTAPSR